MESLLRGRRDLWSVATLLVFGFYILIVVWPLVRLLGESLVGSDGGVSLHNFATFFTTGYYLSVLKNSILVTVCSTVLVVLVAFPLAYFMATVKIKGNKLLQVLILISSMSPPFIGAYSWILLLGNNGAFTNFMRGIGINVPSIYGFGGIVLVMTLHLVPLMFMFLMGAWQTIDKSLLEASELMGISGIRRMLKVTSPLILPTILSGGLLVFMRAFSDFGTPSLIGQGYDTVPVLIYKSFISEVSTNKGLAAAISIVVIVLTLSLFLAQRWIAGRKSFSMNALSPVEPVTASRGKSLVAHLYVYVFIAVAILPTLYVIYTAFLDTKFGVFQDGYSLDSFATALRGSSAIINTIYIGLAAIVIVVVIAVFVSYLSVRRRNALTATIDTMSMIPYIVPGLMIGIAFLLAFNNPPLVLTGTAAIMVIALVIRRLPYTIRSSTAVLYQINPAIEEAAISLGASNLKTFVRITVPMMLPGVISGAILSWVSIITELSATVFLYTVNTQTMSIAIYTQVIRGQYGVAAALSTILTLFTVASLLLFLKLNKGKAISV